MAMLQFEEIKKTSRKHDIFTLFFLTFAQIQLGSSTQLSSAVLVLLADSFLTHTVTHCTFFFSFFFFCFLSRVFFSKTIFCAFFCMGILVNQKVSFSINGLNDREGEKILKKY